ncbi:hypothetical protein ElyMa_000908700 [Elysia marginata]|uniref:CRC domain-containing protein n=1 Tax=Elysia marginata TaxID=1093978 RepID=A0AAV4H8E3_9GAST|nr:hypothetical protein ElyMa_000908700 [Elysia marginata]
MIRCNCKSDCRSKRCTCRKHGLECSLACAECKGIRCLNSPSPEPVADCDVLIANMPHGPGNGGSAAGHVVRPLHQLHKDINLRETLSGPGNGGSAAGHVVRPVYQLHKDINLHEKGDVGGLLVSYPAVFSSKVED